MSQNRLLNAFFTGDTNQVVTLIKSGEDIDSKEFHAQAQDAILNKKHPQFQKLLHILLDRSNEVKKSGKALNVNNSIDYILDYLEKKEIRF